MKKNIRSLAVLPLVLCFLSGCGAVGSKSTSLSVIYGATAALSLLLLIGYCTVVRRRDGWFLLLFSSVVVVNAGYFALSLSKTVEEALLANRISYLGSVCLPLSMLMSILNTTRLQYRKWLPTVLAILAFAVFLVAASPGYLSIYYQDVSLATVNGVAVLHKEYGPLHSLYLFYLVFYFAAMLAAILHAAHLKKLEHHAHALTLLSAVMVNLGVWLLEQLVQLDFEFLSISYIISELFLLGLALVVQESEQLPLAVQPTDDLPEDPAEPDTPLPAEESLQSPTSPTLEGRCARFVASLPELTQTERTIYEFYVEGKTTREIMAALQIKENTLKFHNKNLYGKLGVSSRKQLMELAKAIRLAQSSESTLRP